MLIEERIRDEVIARVFSLCDASHLIEMNTNNFILCILSIEGIKSALFVHVDKLYRLNLLKRIKLMIDNR